MKFLKIVNCPIRGIFPTSKNERIDWKSAGFDINEIRKYAIQGYDAVKNGNYVTLLPIHNEVKLSFSEIVDLINNNGILNDSAEIVDESEYMASKTQLLSVREQMK